MHESLQLHILLQLRDQIEIDATDVAKHDNPCVPQVVILALGNQTLGQLGEVFGSESVTDFDRVRSDVLHGLDHVKLD